MNLIKQLLEDSRYSSKVAKQLPKNLKTEAEILKAAGVIMRKELGAKKANGIWTMDEDFPGDLCSAYVALNHVKLKESSTMKFSDSKWDLDYLEDELRDYMVRQSDNQTDPFWEEGLSSYDKPDMTLTDIKVKSKDTVTVKWESSGSPDPDEREEDEDNIYGGKEIAGGNYMSGILTFKLPLVKGTKDVIDCEELIKQSKKDELEYDFK